MLLEVHLWFKTGLISHLVKVVIATEPNVRGNPKTRYVGSHELVLCSPSWYTRLAWTCPPPRLSCMTPPQLTLPSVMLGTVSECSFRG